MKRGKILGERLLAIRKERKLTGKRVAEMTHLNQSYLSAVERGEKQPSLETMYIIAEALETSVSYLLGETNDPTIPSATLRKSLNTELELVMEFAKQDSLARKIALLMLKLPETIRMKIYQYVLDQEAVHEYGKQSKLLE